MLGPEYSYENNGQNLGATKLGELMGKAVIMADASNPIFRKATR